jgi:hypothetical protein
VKGTGLEQRRGICRGSESGQHGLFEEQPDVQYKWLAKAGGWGVGNTAGGRRKSQQ